MAENKLAASFPKTIACPQPLQDLYDWSQKNGKRKPISGFFETSLHDDESIKLWFGHEGPVGQLAEFGSTGGSGFFCVWLRPDGRMPIVFMGSEGQNNTVIASDARDFLQLLAIGYQDISSDDLSLPPGPMKDQEPEEFEGPNPVFQEWVAENIGCPIPQTGAEIVSKAIAQHDNFQAWIDQQLGEEPAPKPKSRPMSPDDVTTLLGHPVHDVASSALIKGIDPKAQVSRSGYSTTISLDSKGVEISCSPDNYVQTIFLFSGSDKDYARYSGKLPEGLSFDLSKQATRNTLIGTPTRVGKGWDRYDRKDYSLHITYASDESSITLITIMRPDIAP